MIQPQEKNKRATLFKDLTTPLGGLTAAFAENPAIEGEEIRVSAEKALVEKNKTSKKITVDKEAIDALPLRDISELYSLQSGVVRVESRMHGIPGMADKGLVNILKHFKKLKKFGNIYKI